MNANTARKYREQEILTASPAQLVAMLYDKAINSLHEAVRAIGEGDIQGRWQANSKATEIITHLIVTLDMEQGGQIAENLEQLYRFMLRHLLNVDIRNDPKPAQEVIKLLEPLRESWWDLARNDQGSKPIPSAASGSSGGSDHHAGGIEISA